MRLLLAMVAGLLAVLLCLAVVSPARAQGPDCETYDFTASTHGFSDDSYTTYVAGSGFCAGGQHLGDYLIGVNGPSPFEWVTWLSTTWVYDVGTYSLNAGGFSYNGIFMYADTGYVAADDVAIGWISSVGQDQCLQSLTVCGSDVAPTATPTLTPVPTATATATPAPTATATPPIQRYSIETSNYISYTVPYSSCAEVPALFSGMGLNVEHWRQIYNNGWPGDPPLPDGEYISAGAYVTVAEPVACMMLLQTRYSAAIAGRMTNEMVNYAAWNGRALSNGSQWAYQGILYSTGVVSATAAANLDTMSNWLEWGGQRLDLALAVRLMEAGNYTRAWENERIEAWNAFLEDLGLTLSAVLEDLAMAWNTSLLPVLQRLYGTPQVFADTNPGDDLGEFADFVWWVGDLILALIRFFWWLLSLIVEFLLTGATAPFIFVQSFLAALNDPGYNLAVSCDGSGFWCWFFAGVELVNASAGDTIAYPVFIVGVILATIVIFWRDFWSLFHVDIS